MNDALYKSAVTTLLRHVPTTFRVLNVVAESYKDEVGLNLAQELLTAYTERSGTNQGKEVMNELMLVEGAPFEERLDWLADQLQVRTFTYQANNAEEAREAQERIVKDLIGESGFIVAFPKAPCPKMIRPMNLIETLKHRSWGTVAMAVKYGIPVYVYVPWIHNPTKFMGPLLKRAEVLAKESWGGWVSLFPTKADVSEDINVLNQGTSRVEWVPGAPSRPNVWRNN